jgi:hypothetical protein
MIRTLAAGVLLGCLLTAGAIAGVLGIKYRQEVMR